MEGGCVRGGFILFSHIFHHTQRSCIYFYLCALEVLFCHIGKVLRGETVSYASADTISETLEFDLGQERGYSYEGKSIDEAIIRYNN